MKEVKIVDSHYWLRRHDEAARQAAEAISERARDAFMELAGHYWALHVQAQICRSACIRDLIQFLPGEFVSGWADEQARDCVK